MRDGERIVDHPPDAEPLREADEVLGGEVLDRHSSPAREAMIGAAGEHHRLLGERAEPKSTVPVRCPR